MSNLRRPLPGAAVPSVVLVLALGVAACTAGVLSDDARTPDGGGVDVAPTGGVGGTTPPPAADARPNLPEVAIVEGGTCTPSVTCTPPNGRYCGVIGNGCFGMLDCGTCPADQVCEGNVCVGGAGCMALVCQVATGSYCGTMGNGCGRALDCGACDTSLVCTRAFAFPAPAACRSPARPPRGRYCGTIGDGCGGTLTCGDCPTGSTCGGAGVANTCAPTNCTPGTCMAAGGSRYCGSIGDGCGRTLDCGGCTGTQVCTSNICRVPGCVPLTCDGGTSRYCGTIGDGCGGSIECGACTAPATCAGQGVANVCGDPNCRKITCNPTGGGQYCGTIGDGCGGSLNCPMTCPMGTCGVIPPGGTAGIPNVCPIMPTGTVPPTCTGATKTTISGVVYDPAGVNPLYNVIVYVPSGPLPALPSGVTCDRCGAQVVAPLGSALTDTQGRFTMTLEPVVSTTNVPLVMQVGKWRRQITIPTIQTCQNNALTDKNQTRLPRTSAEGNIPRIAVTTGGSDALECLPRRIGLADSEFGTDGSAGRVHLYAGGDGTNSFMAGGNFAPATTLWSSREQAGELRHRRDVVRGEHQQVRGDETPGQHRQRRRLRQRRRTAVPQPSALLLATEEDA